MRAIKSGALAERINSENARYDATPVPSPLSRSLRSLDAGLFWTCGTGHQFLPTQLPGAALTRLISARQRAGRSCLGRAAYDRGGRAAKARPRLARQGTGQIPDGAPAVAGRR